MTARSNALAAAGPAHELFYRALSGRRAAIEVADRVDHGTADPYPDTHDTVRLPGCAHGRAGPDPRAWYRVALAHRALHYAAGTFAFRIDAADGRMAVLRARRGEGRSDLEIFLGSFADRRLALQVFQLLEDMRIDAALPRHYPGLAADLRRDGPPEPLPHEHNDPARDLRTPEHGREPGPLAPAGPRTFVYPEWDCYRGAYRPRWCRVIEQTMPVGDSRNVHALQHRDSWLVRRLRRVMAQAAPEALSVERRVRDGDDIDYEAAAEVLADLRAGRPPGDAVYRRLRRQARDVVVGLLVDASSSTAERVEGATPLMAPALPAAPDGGTRRPRPPRILDLEVLSALICMTTLDSVGDASAAWLFSGTGRERVTLPVLPALPSATQRTRVAGPGGVQHLPR